MGNDFKHIITEPYLYSCNSIVTEVNKEFVDFTGYELDELLGKSLLELGNMLKINSQIYIDNIRCNYSGYIFTKLQSVREVNISLLKSNEINEKLYSFIEKQNSRLEDKLIFEAEAFKDDKSGVAVYSVPDLILLKANQKYLNLVDLVFNKKRNSVGRPISEIVKAFGIDAEVIWNSIIKTQKRTSYIKEFITGNSNSNTTYWRFVQTAIFEREEIKYIFETVSEVNEKAFENQHLEQPIDIIEQSKKIEKYKKELEDTKKKLKLQGEFFVNISHDLKTPLNVISATAQLFDMYCNSGSLDDKKNSIIKYIESIKQNSYRLSKLINNIVDLSKIQSGFFKLKLSNNNIVETVEQIVMSVTNFTDSKGINIIFDTDIEEKNIACDVEKIERLLLNLISNAIKFTDEGGEIFVDVKDKNEFVEISVRDNGIGIEDKYLDMIFDRFKQVGKSLSRNVAGTGIGLSLVKSIVELHGGSVYVESEVGKGTKFTVMLPSKKVLNQNIIYNNEVKSGDQNIRVELSNINS